MDPAAMAKMLPPGMLQQMGGVQAIQQVSSVLSFPLLILSPF